MEGPGGPWPAHFCWNILARKDRDTLIEQSATIIIIIQLLQCPALKV